jgi:hypothetical protein
MTKNKAHVKLLLIHVILFLGLTVISAFALRNVFYSQAQKAFTEGKYEVFAHYLNLSGKDYFEVPKNASDIPCNAFDDCKNLKFNEYKGCDYIGTKANPYYALISANRSQERYEIHPDTAIICDGAFRGAKSITEFVVPTENKHLAAIDGTLYTKDTSRLIHYATGRIDTHFDIPETVKTIDSYAFYYDSHLKSITLPNDLQSIGKFAFGYSLIESITIPNTAVIVGEGAFSNSAVKTVTTSVKK